MTKEISYQTPYFGMYGLIENSPTLKMTEIEIIDNPIEVIELQRYQYNTLKEKNKNVLIIISSLSNTSKRNCQDVQLNIESRITIKKIYLNDFENASKYFIQYSKECRNLLKDTVDFIQYHSYFVYLSFELPENQEEV